MSADQRERDRLRQENSDIEVVMSTENGRRFMWRILSYCGIYQDVDTFDTNGMVKQLGKRQAGLYLLGLLSSTDEDIVFKMMKEAKDAAKDEKIRLQQEEEKQKEEEGSYSSDSIDDIM